MIALALLLSFGLNAGQDAAYAFRRPAMALLAVAGVFALAAQFDVVIAYGTFSGPYVVALALLGATAIAWNRRSSFRAVDDDTSDSAPSPAIANEILRRLLRHKPAVAAALVLGILVETALWAGVLQAVLGVDHTLASAGNRFAPVGFPHLLGTDQLSRDVFLRLCFGGRISLAVGLSAALMSATIGTAVGLFAGMRGGVVDAGLMRVTDAMLSIPVLPLLLITSAFDLGAITATQSATVALAVGGLCGVVVATMRFWSNRAARAESLLFDGTVVFAFVSITMIAFAALLRADFAVQMQLSSVTKIVLLIVAFGWMGTARLARSAALSLKNREFVVAARAMGASESRVLRKHVLPSAMAPIVVAATLDVGANILYEAALSYLGLGVKPPTASWGNMLDHALVLIRTDPALAFWPGAIILVTVTCFNLVGDGLRDATDPHHVLQAKA